MQRSTVLVHQYNITNLMLVRSDLKVIGVVIDYTYLLPHVQTAEAHTKLSKR